MPPRSEHMYKSWSHPARSCAKSKTTRPALITVRVYSRRARILHTTQRLDCANTAHIIFEADTLLSPCNAHRLLAVPGAAAPQRLRGQLCRSRSRARVLAHTLCTVLCCFLCQPPSLHIRRPCRRSPPPMSSTQVTAGPPQTSGRVCSTGIAAFARLCLPMFSRIGSHSRQEMPKRATHPKTA